MSADYQQAQLRKYNRLIKEIKPQMEEYRASTKAWLGRHSGGEH